MARKPLRSQLNQIRAWVRQGRTDAWIAHQLEVSTAELREFRRRHELTAEEGGEGFELRDEIEAEIEAAMSREEEAAEEEDTLGEELAAEEEMAELEELVGDEEPEEGEAEGEPEEAEAPAAEDGSEAPRRRRRRRRGRGGKRAGEPLEATFDHGERDGYGLWLDPAVRDDPVYAEHWAGHRQVEVSIEADRIVIRRV